jgi:hypothetical protein
MGKVSLALSSPVPGKPDHRRLWMAESIASFFKKI